MNKALHIIKKTLKAIFWVVAVFVLLFVLVAGIIQIPFVQNKIVSLATTFVSSKTNTKLEIKNISIAFPKTIVMEGLFVEDTQRDTLLYAGKAKVNIVMKDLLMNKITINNFSLENLRAHLYNSSTDSVFNYNFLLEAFGSNASQITENETPAHPLPESESNWSFSIDKILLKNISIRYDDAFAEMFVGASLNKLTLAMNELDIEQSIYKIDDLMIEGLFANVLIQKASIADDTTSDFKLPRITAQNIQIKNSFVTYADLPNKQSVSAVIKRFELNEGDLDLDKQTVDLANLFLFESEIKYLTSATETLADSALYTAPTSENNWKVNIRNIDFSNNFALYQVGNTAIKNAFDANYINLNHLNLVASNLFYSSDTTSITVKKFSATDHNAFDIKRFETDFIMDKHSITAKNTRANTSNSTVDGDISIGFESLETLAAAHPTTKLDVVLRKVAISNADILYFNTALIEQDFFKNKKNISLISGSLNGSIGNIKGKNIELRTATETILKSDFHIVGLPNFETAHFHFPNLKFNSSKQDIQTMAGSMLPENIDLPQSIAIQAVFDGKIKAFATKVGINTSMGNGMIVAHVDKNEAFNANVQVLNFDLGSLLMNKEMYGPISFTAEAQGQGLEQKTLNANIKANVSKFELNKYNYKNLSLNGVVANQQFDGKINLDDENIVFDFAGLLNFNPGNEQLKFAFDMKGADLQKLKLSEKDLRIAFKATADMKGGTMSNLNGNAGITNIIVVQNGQKYELDSLMAASINQPNKTEVSFKSAPINMKYSGTISLVALPTTLANFIDNYFLIADEKPIKNNKDKSDFSFEIELRNHPILSKVLLPQLTAFEPGIIEGSFDSKKMELKLNANMKRIVYAGTEINNINLALTSDSTTMNYNFAIADIGNEQIKLDNFLFEGKLSNNQMTANISLSDLLNKKLLLQTVLTKENDNFKLHIDPKNFYLMNNKWDIAEDNYLKFGNEGFLFHNFFMQHSNTEVNIASVNNKFNDDISIKVNNFNLEEVSKMLEKDSNLLKGKFDANVLLKRVNNAYGIIAEAFVNDLVLQKVAIGNISLATSNPTADRFDIDLKLSGTDNLMRVNGYFIPNGGENSVSIASNIESLSMRTVEAFSMGQISDASGIMRGNINVAGRTDAPELSGEIVFDNVFMTPSFINNRIGLKNETIHIRPNAILFNGFTVSDAFDQKAILNGNIGMKQFSDFVFNLQLNSKNFLLFNTSAKDNDMFYGRMIVDSKIDISGPMSLPKVNAQLKMKDGSNFTFVLPEGEFSTSKGENIVVFVDKKELNPILNRKTDLATTHSTMSGFDLLSIIEVDKNASLRLLMDPNSSDSLVVRGEAALSFAMDRSGKMSLTGAYNLNEGSYLVSLETFIKRKFDIVTGSTIVWNGDPLDANVSIDASYTVRTAPYNLVADQMLGLSAAEQGAYKQIFPFLVILKLRGAIMNPEISFEIQLLPEDKGALDGALHQKLLMLNDDPSALNKQVFAMLIMGRFVQENPLQSESMGAAALVRSSVSNFLSAQLNKLSEQFVPGVELNFDVQSYDDFQSGEAQGRTQVELGLKKELFNERLTVQVGGVIDVEGDKAKQNSASEIASDVNIEYKITKDGRYRLKGFRNNQYEGIIDGQLIETGVGVVYVREFNKWSEFFKRPNAKKRQQKATLPKSTNDTVNKPQNATEE